MIRRPVVGTNDVLTRSVPAGSYLILAKAEAGNGDGGGVVICRTGAGGDFDQATHYLNAAGAGDTTIVMSVLHTSNAQFTVHLYCNTNGTGTNQGLSNTKITALRVRSISNTAG